MTLTSATLMSMDSPSLQFRRHYEDGTEEASPNFGKMDKAPRSRTTRRTTIPYSCEFRLDASDVA